MKRWMSWVVASGLLAGCGSLPTPSTGMSGMAAWDRATSAQQLATLKRVAVIQADKGRSVLVSPVRPQRGGFTRGRMR